MAHRARAWPPPPQPADIGRSFSARTRTYAKGQLAERERRHGSRPPVLPSLLPSVPRRTFIFGSFAPESQRDVLSFLLFRPNQTRARHRRRFPLAHASVVIVMTSAAAATAAKAGALHVRNGSLVCQTCQK